MVGNATTDLQNILYFFFTHLLYIDSNALRLRSVLSTTKDIFLFFFFFFIRNVLTNATRIIKCWLIKVKRSDHQPGRFQFVNKSFWWTERLLYLTNWYFFQEKWNFILSSAEEKIKIIILFSVMNRHIVPKRNNFAL